MDWWRARTSGNGSHQREEYGSAFICQLAHEEIIPDEKYALPLIFREVSLTYPAVSRKEKYLASGPCMRDIEHTSTFSRTRTPISMCPSPSTSASNS